MKPQTPKVGESAAKAAGNRGKGRPKGVPNKVTGDVRQMILDALRGVGGQDYLMQQAKANPQAFMALVGKVVPKEINAEVRTTLENLIAGSGAEAPK